jgi:hypothetical protein
LLIVIVEQLASLYPSEIMEEQSNIAKEILNDTYITMEDGCVKRPPRGIGLGYYEALKTLGILSIISKYSPISVYGDQGIYPLHWGRVPMEELAYFGFIVDYDKLDMHQNTLKWAGYRMSKKLPLKKPKKLWSSILGALRGNYHWERKKSLESVSEDRYNDYRKIDKYISYFYERMFGYEFFPSDSCGNFYNMGVRVGPCIEGFKKTTLVERLSVPKEEESNPLFYSLPDSRTFKKSESKKFQIKRKDLYRKTKTPLNDVLHLYMSPRIKQRHKPRSRAPLGALPMWADLNLLYQTGCHSGRVTYGLDGLDIHYAVKHQCFAPNPFQSRSMGGYEILTDWHRSVISNEEDRYVADTLTSDTVYNQCRVGRFDRILLSQADEWRYRDFVPDISLSYLRPPKRSLSTKSEATSKVAKVKRVRVTLDPLRQLINQALISDMSTPDEVLTTNEPSVASITGDSSASLRDDEEILVYDDIDDYMEDNL